jgi:hypothetical protein
MYLDPLVLTCNVFGNYSDVMVFYLDNMENYIGLLCVYQQKKLDALFAVYSEPALPGVSAKPKPCGRVNCPGLLRGNRSSVYTMRNAIQLKK